MTIEGIYNSAYSESRVDCLWFERENGEQIKVTWDCSYHWNEDDGSRHFIAEGLFFDDGATDVTLDNIRDSALAGCQLFSYDDEIDFYEADFDSMMFEDNGEQIWFVWFLKDE